MPLTIDQINSRRPEKSRLTAIEFGELLLSGSKPDKTVICRCECGEIKQVRVRCFLTTTYSCGCYNMALITKLGEQQSKYSTIEKVKAVVLDGNRLSPLKFVEAKVNKDGYNLPVIECECVCGKVVELELYHYVNNQTRSCGCLRDEINRDKMTKYPENIRGIQNSYDAMIRRCYNRECDSYGYYGGRGVKVCDEWRNDYNVFLKWAKENGWEKGLKIDKDKLGDGFLYSPETCCWLTHAEQMKYTRAARLYEYMGEMRTATEIGRMNGVKGDKLSDKLKSGLSIEDAIFLTIKNRIKQNRYGKVK